MMEDCAIEGASHPSIDNDKSHRQQSDFNQDIF